MDNRQEGVSEERMCGVPHTHTAHLSLVCDKCNDLSADSITYYSLCEWLFRTCAENPAFIS